MKAYAHTIQAQSHHRKPIKYALNNASISTGLPLRLGHFTSEAVFCFLFFLKKRGTKEKSIQSVNKRN